MRHFQSLNYFPSPAKLVSFSQKKRKVLGIIAGRVPDPTAVVFCPSAVSWREGTLMDCVDRIVLDVTSRRFRSSKYYRKRLAVRRFTRTKCRQNVQTIVRSKSRPLSDTDDSGSVRPRSRCLRVLVNPYCNYYCVRYPALYSYLDRRFPNCGPRLHCY